MKPELFRGKSAHDGRHMTGSRTADQRYGAAPPMHIQRAIKNWAREHAARTEGYGAARPRYVTPF